MNDKFVLQSQALMRKGTFEMVIDLSMTNECDAISNDAYSVYKFLFSLS